MSTDKSQREAATEDAKALFDSGNFAEASDRYLRLSEEFPRARHYKAAFARAAIEACHDVADSRARRAELRDYVLTNVAVGGDERDRALALRFLASLGAWREGAELLLQIEKECATLRDADTCLRFIPRFIERGARAILWKTLLERTRRMRRDGGDAQQAAVLELKLLLAMERFADFLAIFERRRASLDGSDDFAALDAIRARLALPRTEGFAQERVFGIGLSRTATTSLADALSLLGYNAAHWTNPLTHQILSDTDFYLFDASTDCSVSPEFERLYYLYPNAKFVLTQRNLDDWARSFWAHHRKVSWAGDMASFRKSFEARPFTDSEIEFALYTQGPDIRDSYRAFETRVRNFFADKPNGKLLNLDIAAGDGWPQLCAFLDKAVPDAPFPKLNASEAG
jgi:hypothetical protein